MKKIVWLLLVALVFSFGAIAVAEGDHVHQWSEWVDYSSTQMLRYCACGEIQYKDIEATCTHVWGDWAVKTEATCTTAGTQERKCTKCSETETKSVAALGHSFGDWAEKTEATCTEAGSQERKCTKCAEVETKAVAALGHDYGEWNVVTPPTSTTEGKKMRMCNNCGNVEKETIPATGDAHVHDFSDWHKNPNLACEELRICSTCGQVEKRKVEALHVYDEWQVVTEATCAAAGKKARICTNCGTPDYAEIPALPHTEVVIPGKAATCTEKGLTDGKQCSVCKEITVAQKEIELAAHTEVEIPAVAATCTETGLTAGKKCSVCDKVTVAQKEVAAKGHTEVEIPAVAPTCEETGLTAGKKCSVCNAVLVAQTEIKAIGHKYVVKVIAPTTTSRGYNANRCKNCGNFFRSNYVDKLAAEVTVDYLTGIVFDAEMNPVAYTATATVDAAKVLTVKADAAEKNTVRILSLTFDQVELLKADGIKTIVFVVGEHELVIPMDVFAQEMLVVARNYLGEAALGYNFTVACGDAACTMKVEIKTAGEPTDVTAIVTGVELK